MVESPSDAALLPDGAALSAYQYFENVRNFLVAVQEVGIPTFEASDLEQVSVVSIIYLKILLSQVSFFISGILELLISLGTSQVI